MALYLDELGFKSSDTNNDVWMQPACKNNGFEYYEYIIMYVDDILTIPHQAKDILNRIGRKPRIKFKGNKILEPEMYLGAKLMKKQMNGTKCWTISCTNCLKTALENIKETVKDMCWRFPTRATTPMTQNYVPELDNSPDLDAKNTRYYQELIGIFCWTIEIAQVDIAHEIAILCQYSACPREGHMEQLIHIATFIDKHPKITLYMDPSLPLLDFSLFKAKRKDFEECYRDAEEEVPRNQPRKQIGNSNP